MDSDVRVLSGHTYLTAIVALLRRVRLAHPTHGVWEAADLEWWWRKPRSTDELGQLVWFDQHEIPHAAAVATDWGDRVGLDIVTMPGSTPAWIASVLRSGLERLDAASSDPIEVMIDDADWVMRGLLAEAGFVLSDEPGSSAWMNASRRPPLTPLSDRYRLTSRRESNERTHHFASRNGPAVEERLGETSMYRPDLDLVVVDDTDEVVAYGLFWHDPITRVGSVEPMSTELTHRHQGLARHVLTVGLDRLVTAGATRLKVNYENDNVASSALYRSAGFAPVMTTSLYVRRP